MSHLISDLSMIAMFYYLATYIDRYLIIQVYTHSLTHSLTHYLTRHTAHMFPHGRDTYYGQCIGMVKVH